MPNYIAIPYGYRIRASLSDLMDLKWGPNGIVADFHDPDDATHLLRVSFDRPCIIRLLDEMPLSTEEDGPVTGLVREHLAYRVEGSGFARMQSEAWKMVFDPVTHFRFVTGWTCMDVLSVAEPVFQLVRDAASAGP